jgi:solute carrier family 6 (neurotransmitter transporter, glycine) member 5/9
VTLASFNKFTNNCHFDAVIVSLTNFFTAVFAGFVVFAILGFLATSMKVSIDEVMNSGPGLAFVTYPEAVLLMPQFPQLWAILFFSMMFVLGMGSQFGGIEAINTAIIDQWPHLRKHQWRVTAGIYLYTLLEWHTASWVILLIGFAEVIVLSWVYGIDRTLTNIKQMEIKFNRLTKFYWKAIWLVISPIRLLAVFVYSVMDVETMQYRDYKFPFAADALGWIIGFSTLVPLVWSFLKSFLCCDNKMVRKLLHRKI